MKKKHSTRPKNTRKEDIVSAAFKGGELRPLEKLSMTDLYTEVNLVRASYKRFLKGSKASPQPPNPETQLSKIPETGLSAQIITKLLRVQAEAALANYESNQLRDQLFTDRHNKPNVDTIPD